VRSVPRYAITPSSLPTLAKIFQSLVQISRLCDALTITRMRALPLGTVGKPIAIANTPSSNRLARELLRQRRFAQHHRRMGVVLAPVSKPSRFISSLEIFRVLHSRSTSSVDFSKQVYCS